jgi:putative ABC transport system permease protein
VIRLWTRGLVVRRGGRLIAAAAGVAIAVALLASLGAFLTASKSTMTKRAASSVVVDWQVQVSSGADAAAALKTVSTAPGIKLALPVSFGQTTGFQATSGGSTQTTGAGVVLGLPTGYAGAFKGSIRLLAGSLDGIVIAQQTAANLHVAPGSTVTVGRAGLRPVQLRIGGVVDLPQADSLFQKVGAPPQSQPVAPPDNVMLLPQADFQRLFGPLAAARPDLVTTQIHVARTHLLPADPAVSYTTVTAAAHNLEAQLAGAGLVGDNLGTALGGARKDALYAQVLFLFLGLPGAILAAVLTAAIAGAGGVRRRREQALLRARGASMRQVGRLAAVEAGIVGLVGGVLGLATAAAVGWWTFGNASFGATAAETVEWTAGAFLIGLIIAAVSVVVPSIRDFRDSTVSGARVAVRRTHTAWWMRFGVDLILLAISGLVFWITSKSDYNLVLAPDGVATISVDYWAFLGPALLWVGSGLFAWRLALLFLSHGRGLLTRLVRPLTGELAGTTAAGMSRQRTVLARSVVLVALACSFAGSTAVFNSTYQHQAEVDARLTNGADIAIAESPGVQVGPDAATAIAAIPGVRSVEPLQHRYAYVGADLQDLYGVRPATVGAATSLQNAYFQGGTADQLIARLGSAPDSILVSDETVKDFQLSLGDLVKLRLQNGRTKQFITVPFHYAGIAKEFPTAPHDSFFVANADYVAKATSDASIGTFLVDAGRQNVSGTAQAVRAKLGTSATVTDITTTRATIGSSLTSVDLAGLTRVELTFALLLAAAAGGLVLALGLAERRRTFAIAAVLGASTRQLRGLVLSEAALVTVGGLLAGTVGGFLLSQMLVKVLTGVFDPPPEAVVVPWAYLTATAAIAGGAVVGAALMTARRSSRPAVEELREL